MDDVRKIRKRNARENASFISLLTFFYTIPLFKEGRKKQLDDDDLYEVIPKFMSERVGTNLEAIWQKGRKTGQNPSVIRMLVSFYVKRFLILCFVQLCVKCVIVVVQPLALSKLVAYFKLNQQLISRNDAFKYTAMLVGIKLLNTIYTHNYTQFVMETGLGVKTGFTALIYRKLLKLKPSAISQMTMGNVVTLITKDVLVLEAAFFFIIDLFVGVIQTVIVVYILYTRIGWAAMAGIGICFVIIPVQVYVGCKANSKMLSASTKTDVRLQIAKETISAIKVIKMHKWEEYFVDLMNDYRRKEVKSLAVVFYMNALILTLSALAAKLSYYLLLMAYIWMGNYIEAELVYFVDTCYRIMKFCLLVSVPNGIVQTAELFASAKRIQNFLNLEEQIEDRQNIVQRPKIDLRNVCIIINDAKVLKDVSLSVIDTGLILVNGNIGSGKSVLLKTILNQFTISEGKMHVEGSISYASQDPWLFPASIKQNILFGQSYDEKRYRKILDICALTDDLKKFQDGDQTIVGDRGINLSKGQQSRINLARAVYKTSDIYLLDDCLSALDVHVDSHIFNACIKNFLKAKIVILVTHNARHLREMGGGHVLTIENCTACINEEQKQTLLEKDIPCNIDVSLDDTIKDNKDDGTNEIFDDIDDSKIPLLEEMSEVPFEILYHEEKSSGNVDIKVYIEYYKYAGGILLLILLTIVFTVCQATSTYADKLLSKWVNVEEKISFYTIHNLTNTSDYDNFLSGRHTMMTIYSIVTLASVGLSFTRTFSNFFFCLTASRNLHKALSTAVVNSRMQFFDSHFVGNIINRFSKDLATIDEKLPLIICDNFLNAGIFIGITIAIASVRKTFLLSTVVLLVVLYLLRRYYLPVGRAMQRLESATKSPMIGHLNATVEGLSTIKAHQRLTLIVKEFDRHQDLYTSTYYMTQCSYRAFSLVMHITCNAFLACVILQLLLFSGASAGDAGLVISQTLLINEILQILVCQITELENNMTSVERIVEYTNSETEDKAIGEVKEGFPSEGRIEYKAVSLTYKTTKEEVLKDINFVIEPRQKIGIVGRTGSGKSSIVSALFRLYDFDGTIFIDGVDIKVLNLGHLRSKITVIPQDPILFTGTIKSNIDPTGEHPDEEIWEVIAKVNLKDIVSSVYEKISEGGSNYCTGHRQLICLARAMISKNKIVILDEATANIDDGNSALLQKTIRENFADCTMIMISHRLDILADCDKIMVIEYGRIIEFESPGVLLKNANSLFYSFARRDGSLEPLVNKYREVTS